MILDTLGNAARYEAMHKGLKEAFDFLKKAISMSYPVGRYEICGDSIYAMIQEYETKDASEGKAEAHNAYIDVQCVLHGLERFDFFDRSRAIPQEPYNESRDVIFFFDDPNTSQCVLNAGDFAVFFPEDVHKPGLAYGDIPVPVKKVVVKIKR